MITIEEAKTRINNNTSILKDERLALADSLGFVLSEDILSSINLPSFRQSAMDGYAVCFSTQSSTSFKLVEEVKTGDTKFTQLKKGECVRIFTGAMIPEGADAVVMQEKATVKGENIRFENHPSLGDNIREIGEQIKKNEIALSKGTKINAAGIGFLYAVAIAGNGGELIILDTPVSPIIV